MMKTFEPAAEARLADSRVNRKRHPHPPSESMKTDHHNRLSS